MRVSSKILQDLLRPAERAFRINDPLDASGLPAQDFECGWLGQADGLSVEAQLAFSKRLPQIYQKFRAEEPAQYPHG